MGFHWVWRGGGKEEKGKRGMGKVKGKGKGREKGEEGRKRLAEEAISNFPLNLFE